MDDFANQPLDYSNPTPLKLTPVDGDPFTSPSDTPLEPGERSITVTPRDSDASKVTLTPVDHDPFAAPAAPAYDPYAEAAKATNDMGGATLPSFDAIAQDQSYPLAARYAAAVPSAIGQMASGIVDMPRQAIQLGNQVQNEAQGSSPASTDQPVQAAAPSADSVEASTNLAAGLIAPGMQFAEPGAAGIFGGRLAANVNPEALATAQRMAADGYMPQDILAYTGMTQGADQLWRHEISDDGASMHLGAQPGNVYRMGDVLNHPDLYASYPHLAETNLALHDDLPAQTRGYYDPALNTMGVNATMPANQQISTILHELQHGVQGYEGFASGGMPAQVSPELWAQNADLARNAQALAYEQYRRLAGETEARNVQTRMDMTPDERRQTLPEVTQDVPYHQQRVVQHDITGLGLSAEIRPDATGTYRDENGRAISPVEASMRNNAMRTLASPAPTMTPHEARQAALTAELSNYFQTPTRSPVVDKASLPQHVQDLAAQYKVSPHTAQVFQQHLDKAGMPHDEFLNTMFGAGNNHELTTSYNGELNMQSGIRDKDGNYVGLIQRSIDPKTNTADHSFFEVHPDQQGTGIAKDMLRRQIPLYQKMGLDAVTTHANIDVGGYAWARYGFVPTQSSWGPLRSELNGKLLRMQYDGVISAADKERISNSMTPDPASIRNIADNKLMIQPPPPHGLEGFVESPKEALGKHLLLGSSWHGKLDLKDPDTMARFNAYVK